jgi:hypothetical protein
MTVSSVRFSALVIEQAGGGFGSIPYAVQLTTNTRQYPEDAVVFNNEVIETDNAEVGALTRNLAAQNPLDIAAIRRALKNLVERQAHEWASALSGGWNADMLKETAHEALDKEALWTQSEDGTMKTVQYDGFFKQYI